MILNSKSIGNKIAEARKKTNLSQAELAQQIAISPQAVGKWERGESLPDILTLNRLTEILGIDLNYFLEHPSLAVTEPTISEPLNKQSALPTSTPGKKLSWNMSQGNWSNADFSGLKNLNDKFSSSNMQNCKFAGSELSGLLLRSNNIDSCDFSGSDISNSQIQNSNLGNNLFKDCSLKDAQFSGSNISDCDFTAADFTGTTFKSCNLQKNKLTAAVWNRTSFVGMAIDDIVFDGPVEDCSFENCAFYRVTFQNSILTNTFFKNNKNLKRIKFIDCHADRMTYEFLKNGKADLSGITILT